MKTIGLIGGDEVGIHGDLLQNDQSRSAATPWRTAFGQDRHDLPRFRGTGRAGAHVAMGCDGGAADGCGRSLERAGADMLVMCANTRIAWPTASKSRRPCRSCIFAIAPPERSRRRAFARRLARHRLHDERGFLQGPAARQWARCLCAERGRPRRHPSCDLRRTGVGQGRSVVPPGFREIIARQVAAGAQGVILGCTELPMLVKAEDSAVPLFDTTEIHALAAVALALS